MYSNAVDDPHEEPGDEHALERDRERGPRQEVKATVCETHGQGDGAEQNGLETVETNGHEERPLSHHQVGGHQHSRRTEDHDVVAAHRLRLTGTGWPGPGSQGPGTPPSAPGPGSSGAWRWGHRPPCPHPRGGSPAAPARVR